LTGGISYKRCHPASGVLGWRIHFRWRKSINLFVATMNILEILSPNAVKVPLDATDKKSAIEELVDLLHSTGAISNASLLKKVVWEREMQRSTGIGEGLAIPHGKASCSENLAIAIGLPAEPMDYDAVDGKPVRMLVLLASPPDKTADHIQALGKISRIMGNAEFRQRAYAATSAEELFEMLRETQAQATG